MARTDLRNATIVFDLDGTLVDTAPDIANALNDALINQGHRPIPRETIRQAVGFGARVMIDDALRLAGVEGNIDQMLAEFLVLYEANIAAESRPYPGAVATLETLAAAGAKLAVCTNKREYLSKKLLSELGLEHYFHSIAGRDTFSVSKPHPGHLTRAIEQAGGVPSRAIMVGDSDVDLRTAKDAMVPSILVSFGYAPSALEDFAPHAVIDHFDELVPSIDAILGGAERLAPRR